MYKYLIMLTFCVVTQSIYSKSLFEYNVNPEYDLIAQNSNSYSNYWSDSGHYTSPKARNKHHARYIGSGRGYGNRKHELPPHTFGVSSGYNYPDSDEYSDDIYPSYHPYHSYGVSPGQAKKHGSPYRHHHEIPPRFPPRPVYERDFLNPWTLGKTPRPFLVQQPATTKRVTITTPAPSSSTATDDQLIYDIDVRFGRE